MTWSWTNAVTQTTDASDRRQELLWASSIAFSTVQLNMDALVKSLIALLCVFGAALLGMIIRNQLPDECKAPDSKEVVRLGMGLVVTTVALTLGLLVGSAKSFYDQQNAEMAEIAANYVLMDRLLGEYGPEANDARGALRTVLAHQLGTGRQRRDLNKTYSDIRSGTTVGETIVDKVMMLSPQNDDQKFLKQQCLSLQVRLGQIRWLMFAQNTVPFPKLLLVTLIAWLILLFASFGIFAPRNPLVLAGFLASAAVVCGAILLILDLYNAQTGFIRVSDAPLRAAMEQLGR